MPLHFQPVQYVVRDFREPGGFEVGGKFDFVFSIFMLGDGRARAFAAHGEISRAKLRECAAQLRELGVHTLLLNRHGVEQEWRLPQHPPAT